MSPKLTSNLQPNRSWLFSAHRRSLGRRRQERSQPRQTFTNIALHLCCHCSIIPAPQYVAKSIQPAKSIYARSLLPPGASSASDASPATNVRCFLPQLPHTSIPAAAAPPTTTTAIVPSSTASDCPATNTYTASATAILHHAVGHPNHSLGLLWVAIPGTSPPSPLPYAHRPDWFNANAPRHVHAEFDRKSWRECVQTHRQ